MRHYDTVKRVLVTGGAGFLGSHLCKALLERGDDVLCVDNFYTGRKANIVRFMSNPQFEVMRHDITQPLHVEVDEIYNLACPAAPIHYQHDPIATSKTCFMGALNMLGLAKRTGAKILQASTSEVYGDPQMHPQPEHYWGNVNSIGMRSCYDEGKRIAESLFTDYHRRHNVDIRIARIFNTYGPNMHINDGRVVSNFIVQAINNIPITVYGDGDQTRSFCYVDDMVKGLMALMESNMTAPVNLGTTQEISVKELGTRIIKLAESQSILFRKELPVDDPRQRKPVLGRAERTLGWSPQVTLTEGLLNTIAYFRNFLGDGYQAEMDL